MDILLHPTYFPNIAQFTAIAKANKVVWEMEDNYVKQTYRNRTYIYGANGKLLLNIPVVYSQKNRQKYRDVSIFNSEKWQIQHWKSIESAYRTSPFFEYYEDELKPLFFEDTTSLLDFNLKCFDVVCDCLQLHVDTATTTTFEKEALYQTDLRHLVNAKNKHSYKLNSYTQVFSTKHGFIPNLSILDLLCNEGPNALNYLESQTIISL